MNRGIAAGVLCLLVPALRQRVVVPFAERCLAVPNEQEDAHARLLAALRMSCRARRCSTCEANQKFLKRGLVVCLWW